MVLVKDVVKEITGCGRDVGRSRCTWGSPEKKIPCNWSGQNKEMKYND